MKFMTYRLADELLSDLCAGAGYCPTFLTLLTTTI